MSSPGVCADDCRPALPEFSSPASQPAVERAVTGRPTKYDPAYCEQMIAHGGGGLSFDAFAGQIEVSRRTLWNWVAQHPDFAEAVEIAKHKACLHWEKVALAIGAGGGGTGAASIAQFMLKNYGNFADRSQVEHSGGITHGLVNLNITLDDASL